MNGTAPLQLQLAGVWQEDVLFGVVDTPPRRTDVAGERQSLVVVGQPDRLLSLVLNLNVLETQHGASHHGCDVRLSYSYVGCYTRFTLVSLDGAFACMLEILS